MGANRLTMLHLFVLILLFFLSKLRLFLENVHLKTLTAHLDNEGQINTYKSVSLMTCQALLWALNVVCEG